MSQLGERLMREAKEGLLVSRQGEEMIRVRVELVPHGIEELAKQIAVMEIANIGPADKDGNYMYGITAWEDDNPVSGGKADTWTGVLKKFDRKQSIYMLLQRATRLIADRIARAPKPSGLFSHRESA